MEAARPTALPSAGNGRAELRARLQARLGEIEAAALARVHAISDPSDISDPAYADGLHTAIGAAIGYALDSVERGSAYEAPVPVALLTQARLAARVGVSLDAVLRRYFAGYTLLGGLLIEEAHALGLSTGQLSKVLTANAGVFDRLLAAVSEEHVHESNRPVRTADRRRFQLVSRLLEGERIDPDGLAYDLDTHHLGLLAEGREAEEELRSLATSLARRLLIVRPDEGTVWAWLGGRRLDPTEVSEALQSAARRRVVLALGEPGHGLSGWRLTHRQAAAALPVARRGPDHVARYADVALLAAALRDDLLAASLRRLYLEPLERLGDRAETARQTLRAYLAANRNVSSAAAALGVSRPTVRRRLRAVEARIGTSLDECGPELELALRLERLANPDAGSR